MYPNKCLNKLAPLLLVVATGLWGLSGIATKTSLAGGIDSLEIAFWRLLFGGMLFGVHAAWRKQLVLASPNHLWEIAGYGIFILALNYVAFTLAVEYGGISLVNLFLASVPVLVMLVARAVLGERLTVWKSSLALLSTLGFVLVTQGNSHGVIVTVTSVSLSALMALTVVGYTIISKRLLRHYTPTGLSALAMPIGALALLPLVSFSSKTPSDWVLLAILTLFPTYLAHLLYQHGLRSVEASRAALLVNVEIVTALVSAALFFGERFTPLGLVGVLLILGVSGLVVVPEPRCLKGSRVTNNQKVCCVAVPGCIPRDQ